MGVLLRATCRACEKWYVEVCEKTICSENRDSECLKLFNCYLISLWLIDYFPIPFFVLILLLREPSLVSFWIAHALSYWWIYFMHVYIVSSFQSWDNTSVWEVVTITILLFKCFFGIVLALGSVSVLINKKFLSHSHISSSYRQKSCQ